MYYFGCYGHPGHFFHRPGQYEPLSVGREVTATFPWSAAECDGELQPGTEEMKKGYPTQRPDKQEQGICRIHHKSGWTALAFWDRSGDRRGNSCSTLIIDKELDFHDMIAEFQVSFPQIYKRVTAKFDLVEERRT